MNTKNRKFINSVSYKLPGSSRKCPTKYLEPLWSPLAKNKDQPSFIIFARNLAKLVNPKSQFFLMNAYMFRMIPTIKFVKIINKRRIRVYLYRNQWTSICPTISKLAFFYKFIKRLEFWWRSYTFSKSSTSMQYNEG